jgi:ATP-binding cassette subfamily B protein
MGIIRVLFSQWVVEHLMGFIASLALVWGMFRFSGQWAGAFLTSNWPAILLLMASIIIPLSLRLMAITRAMRSYRKSTVHWHGLGASLSYYSNYIKSEGAGKDIRIFNQAAAVIKLLRGGGHLTEILRLDNDGHLAAGLTAAVGFLVGGASYAMIGLRALAGMYGIGQVMQYVGAFNAMTEHMSELISCGAHFWETAPFLPIEGERSPAF